MGEELFSGKMEEANKVCTHTYTHKEVNKYFSFVVARIYSHTVLLMTHLSRYRRCRC